MSPRPRLPVVLLSLLAAGCGARDDPGAWSERDSAGVSIVENSRPRHADWAVDPEPVWEVASGLTDPVSVFEHGGRVHVADRAAGAVLAFDRDGRELRRVGSLATVWWAAPYLGDSILAFELGGKQLVVLAEDGSGSRELAIPIWRRDGAYGVPGYTAGAVGATESGHFLTYPVGAVDRLAVEGPAWYRHDLVRVHPSGEAWDTLGVFEIFQTWLAPEGIAPYPFGPVAQVAPFQDGFLFTTGETFQLAQHDSTGALRRIVRRASAPAVVNAADLQQYRDWFLARARASGAADPERLATLEQQLDSAPHPERRPAISHLLVDSEGNAWAEAFRWVDPAELAPEPRPSLWSVFDAQGRWLAEVEVPAGFLVSSVTGERVYGVAVDEAGAKRARAYRLRK